MSHSTALRVTSVVLMFIVVYAVTAVYEAKLVRSAGSWEVSCGRGVVDLGPLCNCSNPESAAVPAQEDARCYLYNTDLDTVSTESPAPSASTISLAYSLTAVNTLFVAMGLSRLLRSPLKNAVCAWAVVLFVFGTMVLLIRLEMQSIGGYGPTLKDAGIVVEDQCVVMEVKANAAGVGAGDDMATVVCSRFQCPWKQGNFTVHLPVTHMTVAVGYYLPVAHKMGSLDHLFLHYTDRRSALQTIGLILFYFPLVFSALLMVVLTVLRACCLWWRNRKYDVLDQHSPQQQPTVKLENATH